MNSWLQYVERRLVLVLLGFCFTKMLFQNLSELQYLCCNMSSGDVWVFVISTTLQALRYDYKITLSLFQLLFTQGIHITFLGERSEVEQMYLVTKALLQWHGAH